jgi:cytochrome c-type biogenesis protein CcmH
VRRAALIGALATLLIGAAPAGAATAHASLTDIENDVMCVACHEPLAVSQAPQANSERAFISMLIAQGETKPQIERALVAQYGTQVLGKPPAHGFNLTVYILPPAILLLGAAGIAFALPRWRARTRERLAPAGPPTPALQPQDAHRLEEDLARYDG